MFTRDQQILFILFGNQRYWAFPCDQLTIKQNSTVLSSHSKRSSLGNHRPKNVTPMETSVWKDLKGKIVPDCGHQHAFKTVGGTTNIAEVEKGRYAKWAETVTRMRHSPLLRDKSTMLLATKAQATYGQGTHSFRVPDDLTKIRSGIMRAMFSLDFYPMKTHLTFAILLPPQLDAYFGHVYQGLSSPCQVSQRRRLP